MPPRPPKNLTEPAPCGDGEVHAEHSTNKVVPLEPAWRASLRSGLQRLRRRDHQGAVEAFERALRQAPDEPEVLLAAGRAFMRQKRFVDAERVLRRAVQAQPDSVTAVAMLARVLGLHLDRRQEAFSTLHRLLRGADTDPSLAPLQVVRGELLLEEGAITDARAAFGMVLDRDVAHAAARAGVARTFNAEGIVLSERGDWDRAIFCFKRAADLDPLWSGPCVNLGVVFGRLGKLERALSAYECALERDPSNPVAYFNVATTHQELGHHADAISHYEQLLEVCPEFPQVRTALANALGESGETDRAIALLLEELEIDAGSVTAWSSLGLAYICSGNTDRGEQCLKRALELDPNYFNAYYNLAALYVAERRLDQAEAMLRHAFDRQPRQTARLFASDRQFSAVRRLRQFDFISRTES
jgi:tetratricopeptide (TPR) repeat protein